MKLTKCIPAIVLAVLLGALPNGPVSAQEFEPDVSLRAIVTSIEDERSEVRENGSVSVHQRLVLEGLNGEWRGREIVYDGMGEDVLSAVRYEPGDKLMLVRTVGPDGEERFYVTDFVRTVPLLWLALLFVAVVFAVGRLKGLRALVVLVVTFLIILKVIIPLILSGFSPVAAAVLGSLAILVVAIYFTEGVSRSSHLAVVSVALTLLVTGLLSVAFVGWAHLTGFESEDVMLLVSSAHGAINVRGLLLAGIIVGTLGVLDDVVISQIAVVEQLKRANPGTTTGQAYGQAMKVGVSHLSSMVNTLFLAYAGASMPLLLLFSANDLAPLGFSQAMSNEMLATEIVRTVVGSLGLVLAVPLSTLLAARFLPTGKRTEG